MSCNGGYVLVVDDDVEIRRALTEIVSGDYGHNVKLAGDGCEALGVLSRFPPPSLMIVDLMMPRMDGVELLDRLSQQARLADVPFCLMTASLASSAQLSRMNAVFARTVTILRKPFDLDELMSFVERYC